MRIENFEEVREKLYPHLGAYLEEHEIDTSKNFSCLSPDHQDRHPSCSINGKNRELAHCLACGWSGDIFTVANILEKKPLSGPAFIEENVLYLAKKFGIEVELGELTESQIYELDTYRAYRAAAEYIVEVEPQSQEARRYIEEHDWDTEQLKQFGVGSIESMNSYKAHLVSKGFTVGFLREVDLLNPHLFAPENLIFTIRDEHGRPCGFAARRWDERAKFLNQKTTGLRCNIYQKHKRLYGLHIAKEYDQPIYIFEGYTDVITAYHHGMFNCVAVGGTAFTTDHVRTLEDANISSVVVAFDGDEGGYKATKKAIEDKLGTNKYISTQVLTLPDGSDPDSLIREQGISTLKSLQHLSAFDWRLSQFEEDLEPHEICTTMVPIIAAEPVHVKREVLARSLARFTGISMSSILADVEAIDDVKTRELQRERRAIIDRATSSIREDPDNAEIVLAEAAVSLGEVNSRFSQDRLSASGTLSLIRAQKESEESSNPRELGFVLGEDLQGIQTALTGEWKKDVFIAIGGNPNVGKSSLCLKLGLEIAKREEENNAVVIYHTIDDSAPQLLPRCVTILDGSRELAINDVMNPNTLSKKKQGLRAAGYKKLISLVEDERFILKDMNDGLSLAFAESLIKHFKHRHPDRNLVYILDNFHKLGDFVGLDERNRFKLASKRMKEFATQHHVAVISTMEYTKLPRGTRPSNNHLIETNQMSYDANIIIHLYSDMHEYFDQSRIFHVDSEGNKLPTIEATFGKNKVSSFKGTVYLDMWPASADFTHRPATAIDQATALLKEDEIDEALPA